MERVTPEGDSGIYIGPGERRASEQARERGGGENFFIGFVVYELLPIILLLWNLLANFFLSSR